MSMRLITKLWSVWVRLSGNHNATALLWTTSCILSCCSNELTRTNYRHDMNLKQSFQSTDSYVATDDLRLAVDAALSLQRPLLVKGEPGTGKTMLAEEVAKYLGRPLLQWHIKSTTKAQQGLYEYDAVSRLRDSQLGDERV